MISAIQVMMALLLPALAAASSYGDLWQAMQFANTPNFRHDIGTVVGAPVGGEVFELADEAAFRDMVTGPLERMGLRWQDTREGGETAALDDALSSALRAQVQRIRGAQAGDTHAQQVILTARKRFALAHGSVFGHSPREYLTDKEWADYEAAQAAVEYRLAHPDLGPGSNSP
jgi:hypothetical protein